jgi:hypothetical protein
MTSLPAGHARTRRYGFTLGDLVRSLLGKLILLLIVFMTVPVILYSEFRQADAEKRALLLESARAQGRLIAESLRPLLEREGAASLPELNDAIRTLATNKTGIKVLYHPAGGTASRVSSSSLPSRRQPLPPWTRSASSCANAACSAA